MSEAVMDENNAIDTTLRWAAAQELESSRHLIERLYKNHKLGKVMEIMKSEHQLMATENMYKKRISKWGLDTKKNKEPVMKAIIRKENDRTILGKRSIFRAHGRHIKFEEVIRYWERKQKSPKEVLALCRVRDARRAPGPTPHPNQCRKTLIFSDSYILSYLNGYHNHRRPYRARTG